MRQSGWEEIEVNDKEVEGADNGNEEAQDPVGG